MGAVAADVDAAVPQWFRAQMARMMGLRFVPHVLNTHWESLREFTESEISSAVSRVIAGDVTNFPAPWLLRSHAEQARARELGEDVDRGVDLAEPRLLGELPTGTRLYQHREWKYYHEDCLDMGTISVWCGDGPGADPWEPKGHCGRRGEHASHRFDVPCPCRDSNPDIQRRKERQRHSGGKRGE